MEQYLNFVWTRFLISVLVFVSRDYELGGVSDFGGVDRQSRTGLIFIICNVSSHDKQNELLHYYINSNYNYQTGDFCGIGEQNMLKLQRKLSVSIRQ